MQENSFENEVRQRLNALHLTPSEPVWQKVEAALKKKRKRRLVLWLLPFLIWSAGIGLWLTSGEDTMLTKPQPSKAFKRHQPFSKPHVTGNGKKEKQNAFEKNNVTASKNAYVFQRKEIEKQVITISSHTKSDYAKNKKTWSKAGFAISRIRPGGRIVAEKPAPDPEQIAVIKTTYAGAQRNVDLSEKIRVTVRDGLKKTIQPPIKISPAKPKLQWSVVSRGGISNAVENILNGFSGNKSLRQSNASNDYTTGNPTGNPPGSDTLVRRQPEASRKGVQFSIGTVVKKKMGKKTQLLAGLQYSFYSNHLTVGRELSRDSVVGSSNRSVLEAQKLFRNDGLYNRFTNTFHFIELPVGIEYHLLRKQPLAIQHGFTFSRLVASRALQYDGATNTYYQSATGFRKTGVSFFTAMQYTLWEGRAFSLQAGPHLQWGLQHLSKTTNQHVAAHGIVVTMGF